jgi:hypothetical protein
MRGLRLWDFLTGELSCPPSPLAPTQPVITEKTTAAEKEVFLADYDNLLASYESQFMHRGLGLMRMLGLV